MIYIFPLTINVFGYLSENQYFIASNKLMYKLREVGFGFSKAIIS